MSSAVTAGLAGAVVVGAAVGAQVRRAAGLAFSGLRAGLSLGALRVNCLGGLLIGVAIVWPTRPPVETLRVPPVTGGLGTFTTCSSFSADSLGLLRRQQSGRALRPSAAHRPGALACTAVGFVPARATPR